MEVGCPKHGNPVTIAPPNTTHILFTTQEPNSNENCIEMTVTCPDDNHAEGRKIPHDFKIYWYMKDVRIVGGPIDKTKDFK